MALLHVSLPPGQACGAEDILYIYLLDILSSGPHYKSLSGAVLWLHPVTRRLKARKGTVWGELEVAVIHVKIIEQLIK